MMPLVSPYVVAVTREVCRAVGYATVELVSLEIACNVQAEQA